MTARATATFEITGWEETPYDVPADGPTLVRTTVKKTFQGDLTGQSVAELLMCQAEGGAGYVAAERIVGRIADRAGTFVLQHGGTQDGDASHAFGTVVPGSGTGALVGLRGTAAFQHDETGATLTLEYDLP